jgi:hypothetical protein
MLRGASTGGRGPARGARGAGAHGLVAGTVGVDVALVYLRARCATVLGMPSSRSTAPSAPASGRWGCVGQRQDAAAWGIVRVEGEHRRQRVYLAADEFLQQSIFACQAFAASP